MADYCFCTPDRTGAVAIVYIAGTPSELALLDAAVGTAPAPGGYAHGWLRHGNQPVDEVILAHPSSGGRLLMTHGGSTVRASVQACLDALGFVPLLQKDLPGIVYDPLLAAAVTDTQVAAILRAGADRTRIPAALLSVHRVVLAGAPNAGKSSLLNCMAGQDRALVHHQAGSTADVVDVLVDIGGHAVLAADLPGFAPGADDPAARALAGEVLAAADIVLFVCDASHPWGAEEDAAARTVAAACAPLPPVLVVLNKADLPCAVQGAPWAQYFPAAKTVHISSLPGHPLTDQFIRSCVALLQ